MKLIWLPEAIATRQMQLDYIAKDNLLAAIEQGEAIERQVDRLPDHPMMGRSGRLKSTRELVISRTPFIAVYRLNGEHIEILRILHGAQQWPREF